MAITTAASGMSLKEERSAEDPATLYDRAFFRQIAGGSSRSAARIVPELLWLIAPESVVDVGCGQGIWLAEFQRHGVADVLGIDGAWVEQREFLAGSDRFLAHDLRQALALDRRFELVITLEVAEHLPPERSESFVADLVALGPVIAFSASILDCTGTGEVNQQWPDYWAGLFAAFDYAPLDCLRFKIWDDAQIDWWYRQNLILYAHRDYIAARPHLRQLLAEQPPRVRRLVHPENYVEKTRLLLEPNLMHLLRALPRATLRATARRLRSRVTR